MADTTQSTDVPTTGNCKWGGECFSKNCDKVHPSGHDPMTVRKARKDSPAAAKPAVKPAAKPVAKSVAKSGRKSSDKSTPTPHADTKSASVPKVMEPHSKDREIVERPLSFYREARSCLSAIARSSGHSKCPELALLEKMINSCIFEVTNPRAKEAAEAAAEVTAEASAKVVLDEK